MKKTIKLAVVAALALGATSAFATNGSELIGMGAKSRGMGGASIGVSHGAESALSNPALITSVKDTEVSFAGTIFMPYVKNSNGMVLPTGTAGSTPTGQTNDSSTADSQAKLNVIPEVSIASKVTDNFYIGVGMWGTAGMGTDYRDAKNTGQMQMVTNLQLMQFGVPLAYTTNGFSAAITPVLQYGSLDINYVMSKNLQNAMYYQQTGTMGGATQPSTVGAGVAQDLKFGYNIGLAYEYEALTVGAVYKSQIDMEYNNVLSNAAGAMTQGAYTNNKLSTPAELGLGFSYKLGTNTFAFDYKYIKWSQAKGYQDFKWEDQNVFAFGYEYTENTWALRAGFNYSASPIKDHAGEAAGSNGLNGNTINTFNLLGFPAIVTTHYTLGGSYNLTETTSFDAALTYAAEASENYKNFLNQDISTTHSQVGVTLGLNYNF